MSAATRGAVHFDAQNANFENGKDVSFQFLKWKENRTQDWSGEISALQGGLSFDRKNAAKPQRF